MHRWVAETHRHWRHALGHSGNLKAEPGVLSLRLLLATPPIFGSKPLLDGQKELLVFWIPCPEVLLPLLWRFFLAEDD